MEGKCQYGREQKREEWRGKYHRNYFCPSGKYLGYLPVKQLVFFLGHFLFPALLQACVALQPRSPSVPGCGLCLAPDKTVAKV